MSSTETNAQKAVREVRDELERRLEWSVREDKDINRRISGGAVRHLKQVPKIICEDGFCLSVQASEFHYCLPRASIGPWSAVEVGFPSARAEQFMPFIDGREDDDPTTTVYGYVPVDLVAEVIAEHGGFAKAKGPRR